MPNPSLAIQLTAPVAWDGLLLALVLVFAAVAHSNRAGGKIMAALAAYSWLGSHVCLLHHDSDHSCRRVADQELLDDP
jgi:hypothetical protein